MISISVRKIYFLEILRNLSEILTYFKIINGVNISGTLVWHSEIESVF